MSDHAVAWIALALIAQLETLLYTLNYSGYSVCSKHAKETKYQSVAKMIENIG
jgi:hypothetical protein